MKKLLLLPLLAVFALFVSCSDNDDSNLPEVKSEVFFGSLLFNGSSVAEDVKCGVDIVGEYASITLNGVTFAPTMPAMDIVISALDCKKSGDNYVITGKSVVPTVMGAPMDRYLMTTVEASLVGDKFVLNTVTAMGTIGFSNAVVNIKPVGGSAKNYKGSLVVGDFTKEDVVIGITKNGDMVDILLNDVKFAANMPLVLDITLKDVPCETDAANFSFAAENVAPYMNTETEPAPQYMFAAINGTVEGSKLVFDAKMAEGLAPYLAGKKFVFSGYEIAE